MQKEIKDLINICIMQQQSINKLIGNADNINSSVNLENMSIYSEDSISIGAFAKLLHSKGVDIGRNRLFSLMRSWGYIMKQGDYNEVKQCYLEQGLFTSKQYVVNTKEGCIVKNTIRITIKGQKHIANKLIGGDVYEYVNCRF